MLKSIDLNGSRRRRPGFTLVELLVVVGIIAVLVAMLLPALTKARQKAQQVACLTNIRQTYMAMAMYANTFREYPLTFKPRALTDPGWNPGGEQAGHITPTILPLLVNYGYVTNPKVLQCNAAAPGPFPFMFSGLVTTPWYDWAGPSAYGGYLDGYGHKSGLRWNSHFYVSYTTVESDSHYWGCSVHNKWMRLMAVCPSIMLSGTAFWVMEPHGTQPIDYVYCQTAEQWTLRRRNILFNDGHAEYWNRDAPAAPGDYQ